MDVKSLAKIFGAVAALAIVVGLVSSSFSLAYAVFVLGVNSAGYYMVKCKRSECSQMVVKLRETKLTGIIVFSSIILIALVIWGSTYAPPVYAVSTAVAIATKYSC